MPGGLRERKKRSRVLNDLLFDSKRKALRYEEDTQLLTSTIAVLLAAEIDEGSMGLQIKQERSRPQENLSRTVYPRRDPRDSPWWKEFWIDEPNRYRNQAPDTYKGTIYRKHFRMSFKAFKEFVNVIDAGRWFPNRYIDNPRARGAPLPLLVMGCLSVLGGGIGFDMLPLMTHISSQTHRTFFNEFVAVGAKQMFTKWVVPPSTDEDLRSLTEAYTAAGLPGAIGSTDGVRVRLLQCSYSLHNDHVGKEGFPVRTFQVTVGNDGRVLHCTQGFDGNQPDTKITLDDRFLNSVKLDELFRNFEWEAMGEDGEYTTCSGAWILVDNGYPTWPCLQCPSKFPIRLEELRFSRMLESLRKDVERFFGILKQRFRLLKFGLSFHSLETIEHVFHTCCALHNFLLILDDKYLLSVPLCVHTGMEARFYRPCEGDDKLALSAPPSRNRLTGDQFLDLREKLITHFARAFENDQLLWPVYKIAGFIRRRLEKFGVDKPDGHGDGNEDGDEGGDRDDEEDDEDGKDFVFTV
jgi:hypothetical protein